MTIINIAEKLDQSRFSKAHFLVLFLCTLCMIIDGFDVQAISFAAPTLIAEWGVDKQSFGSVFGAGLLGMAIGAFTLAPLADKLGRKPILIISMIILSLSMGATVFADNMQYLKVVRFIAGISLGAIVPNAVALAGEFSPAKIRVTSMMIISSGFILGGVLGGALASYLIPLFGWQMVFIIGAIAPFVMAMIMIFILPESLLFLTVQKKKLEQINIWLKRLQIEIASTSNSVFPYQLPQKTTDKASLKQLFANGLALGTILLWVILFMNLLATFFLANWLPILISQSGYAAQYAVWAGATFWLGGLFGNLVLGRFIDRYGFGSTLLLTFILGILFISSIGFSIHSLTLVFVFIALTGFCILGAQTALNALAAVYYPTEFRSTGAGWALGMGRLGSIFGPVIGGILIGLGLPITYLFFIFTIPILCALVAMFVFWKMDKLPTKELDPVISK
ncbi:MFS transporter [Acinetobacter schindleri]|uniref:MFS transporter n=1 Tax=Acinetobacter schindleri TaxID=108981 RepID=UPI002DBDB027|nr:MFS transporter [Acinetobacter schindleri]MEB5929192.1 MFS transporter [Acinetobacter schindleri]